MRKFVNRAIIVLIILFFITISAGDNSLSLYTSTHNLSSVNIGVATIKPSVTNKPVGGIDPEETVKPVQTPSPSG